MAIDNMQRRIILITAREMEMFDPNDDHPTECACAACKAFWASIGCAVPTNGEDEPDPELEDGAEE